MKLELETHLIYHLLISDGVEENKWKVVVGEFSPRDRSVAGCWFKSISIEERGWCHEQGGVASVVL